ncbi:MAG TPA: hypothetical protein DF613_16725 [Lachnospiraceae bacterium]|nr:hypothetical protein [Lachnospiraceae bacterium]
MINVKDQIYEALKAKLDNVTDAYPTDWADLPAVQYMEEENNVSEYTDKEDKAYCRYRVDIWHSRSTSAAALLVDEAIAGLGLKRTQCADVDDPGGRLKHKVMRYEMIIDVETQEVYHRN